MDGVLVVDKPAGLTSHDVVALARRALGERRIGHTGTLDPLATGVLPLACGRATRLVRFLAASDKEYEARIRFGVVTDSYDVTGAVVSRSDRVPDAAALERALASLRGAYEQTPPPYSAKKVGGERAYALARREQPVALTPVPVRVAQAELLAGTGPVAVVRITCSAGFYVRAFAHELGVRVGTGACLDALRRTRSGDFGLEEACTLDELAQPDGRAAGRLIPLERLLPGFPAVTVTGEGRRRVAHGRALEPAHVAPRHEGAGGRPAARARGADAGAWVRLFDADGRLLALATPGTPSGVLHPSVVLI